MVGQPLLISELEQGVLTLRLNRPDVRNALSAALRADLQHSVAQAQENPNVRVIVLTGTDPAFCAGIDLAELRDASIDATSIGPRTTPFLTSQKPLIGAINGATYTGGLELALSCHFLIASEKALFADTHARFGLTPGWGLTVLLTEAIGSRRARQMAITSDPISARTALAWGLVNEVIAHDQLLDRAKQIAMACIANDARAVGTLGHIFNDQQHQRTEAAWAIESQRFLGARISGTES